MESTNQPWSDRAERSGTEMESIPMAKATNADPCPIDLDGSEGEDVGAANVCFHPVQRLSCDHCRQRKIRCDREQPCGPCTRRHTPCTFPAESKPRQRRQRILVSTSYEEKIDEISRKLDRICSLVGHGDGSISGARASATPYSSPFNDATHDLDEDPESVVDGELSLTAYAAFATDFVQRAVSSSPFNHLGPQVTSSINALRQIVDKNSPKRKTLPDSSPNPGSGTIQMPPLEMAMTCLRLAKENPRLKYFWGFEFDSIGQFMEYFLTVYTGQPSHADHIIVNCGLNGLFIECSTLECDFARRGQYKSSAQLCRQNAQATMSRLPFNLPSTIDYVLALSMASLYCMETCKLSLAWNYIVAASQMSQSLGFHRDTPPTREDSEGKRRRSRIFWYMCLVEKMMALRIGRRSTIIESDITLPRLEMSSMIGGTSHPMFSKWVDIIFIHGRVYEEIFSPTALMQAEAARTLRARNLATELQTAFHRQDAPEFKTRYLAERRLILGDILHELLIRAERMNHLAVLSLIYRAIPPEPHEKRPFCQECINSAIEALQEHEHCLGLLRDQDENTLDLFIQLALVWSPFIPFVVVFCYVIETSSMVHLEKLTSLIETLERVATDFPAAYRRQFSIFKQMHDVACRYVEATPSPPIDLQASGPIVLPSDFDAFFGEIGVEMPPQAPHGQEQAECNRSPKMDIDGARLENWFDQNRQLFQLLEEEL